MSRGINLLRAALGILLFTALPLSAAGQKDNPKNTREYFMAGHEAMNKGDELGVVDFFTKAAELATKDTDKAIALNNIGYFYLTHGAFDKAKEYLEKASSYDKTNKKPVYRAKIWNNLGQVYEYEKDQVKALACYIKACMAEPTYEKPQLNKARLERIIKEHPVASKTVEAKK